MGRLDQNLRFLPKRTEPHSCPDSAEGHGTLKLKLSQHLIPEGTFTVLFSALLPLSPDLAA